MCREPCTKLGMNWEERILRLHWMVHAVVHTQHFINKHNVKCKLYGPWGHFLGQCTLKLITLSLRRAGSVPKSGCKSGYQQLEKRLGDKAGG